MAESPGPGVARHPNGSAGLAHLIAELQGHGLRVEVPLESRQGGAGPADAGMLWIDGFAATVPTSAEYVQASPYVLRAEDDGWGVYRDGERLASAEPFQRPRYYDLTTADGVPYWQIALLHLDSLASTVIQTCAYWGQFRPVRVLRDRSDAGERQDHRQEDAGDAGRGRGGGQGT